mgnify:CR=1 FL=1
MPQRYRPAATFGIWSAATPGEDTYEFVRWLTEDRVPADSSLFLAADHFAEHYAKHPGKYMVQVLTRGQSGQHLQALTFTVEPVRPVFTARFG